MQKFQISSRERAKFKRFRENLFSRIENIENKVFEANVKKTPQTFKKAMYFSIKDTPPPSFRLFRNIIAKL